MILRHISNYQKEKLSFLKKMRKRGKLKENWLGLYAINRSIEKGLYELRNTKGKVLKAMISIARMMVFCI